MTNKRWKILEEEMYGVKHYHIVDDKLGWRAIQNINMQPDGEDPKEIAQAICDFLNEKYPDQEELVPRRCC